MILINCDWAALSVHTTGEWQDVDGYSVEDGSPTNVWGRRRIVYNERGQRVFTFLSEPRSAGFLRADAALLEVSNEWLYHGLGLDGVLRLARQFQEHVIVGFSRLDIAADFCPDAHQREVIEGLSCGQYYVAGKRSGSQFWSVNKSQHLADMWCGRAIPHCQSWGHKTTAVKWKLYYKTKELWDAGSGKFIAKPYIEDCWRMAKMDVTNVWRLEVSIKHGNEYLSAAGDITVENVLTRLDDIISDCYNGRFVVRRNQGHKDKTNDEFVPFLSTEKCVSGFRRRHPKSLALSDAHITLLRHLVAACEEPSVYCDVAVRDATLSSVKQIVEVDGLERYFKRVKGMSVDAWMQDVRCRKAALQHAGAAEAKRGSISAVSTDIQPNMYFDANARQEVTDSGMMQEYKRSLDRFVASLDDGTTVKYYGSNSGKELLFQSTVAE